MTKKLYCISIIDYLQEFNFQKKMELWLKRIFKGGGDISSVDTEVYHQRFMKFIKRIIITFQVSRLVPVRGDSATKRDSSTKRDS